MNSLIQQIRSSIEEGLRQALSELAEDFQLEAMPQIILEQPNQRAHGNWATNLAMVLTKQVKRPPREIAELLKSRFQDKSGLVQKVEIAGPGFLNFYLAPLWRAKAVAEILAKEMEFGNSNLGSGQKVLLEFVSANPTGPLHVGHGRGAAVGSALATILAAAGYDVTCEFYLNDAGNQIEKFAESLEVRYRQALGQEVEMPEDGYHGKDLVELMEDLASQKQDQLLSLPENQLREALVEYALPIKVDAIKRDLEAFGVHFDSWFSESVLHPEAIEGAVEQLKEIGSLYEQDGALWLRSSAFGDDKDRVVIRDNGVPTYLAADIAYHKDKYTRGFDRLINIWGADHHGYIARIKAAVQALGYDPEKLAIIIVQMVNLFRAGQAVTMSKRTGELVTLAEIVEEVGRDSARFFFLMRSSESQLDFDLDLAKEQSDRNPVFYVQYAHARICSILRTAEEQGIEIPLPDEGLLATLTSPEEELLMEKLAELPIVVWEAAERMEPHKLAHYAQELAGQFHLFYNRCRVLGAEEELQAARLLLISATRIVLAKTLQLLGISAPEQM
ncbi:MAG: arginine--tRNA ligase [Firmicutes bacterium]|nr:arginine--tRNA ligase [Bacillota bacterium]HQD40126.1 arginine--tRNA ligase [Bacillota bacterium]